MADKTPAQKRAEADAKAANVAADKSTQPAPTPKSAPGAATPIAPKGDVAETTGGPSHVGTDLPEHSHEQPEFVAEADAGDVAPAVNDVADPFDWGGDLPEPADLQGIRDHLDARKQGAELPEPTWDMVELLLQHSGGAETHAAQLEESRAAFENDAIARSETIRRLNLELAEALKERDRVSAILREVNDRPADAPPIPIFDFAALHVGQSVTYHPGGNRHGCPAILTAINEDSVNLEYPHHANPAIMATAERVTQGAGVYCFEV